MRRPSSMTCQLSVGGLRVSDLSSGVTAAEAVASHLKEAGIAVEIERPTPEGAAGNIVRARVVSDRAHGPRSHSSHALHRRRPTHTLPHAGSLTAARCPRPALQRLPRAPFFWHTWCGHCAKALHAPSAGYPRPYPPPTHQQAHPPRCLPPLAPPTRSGHCVRQRGRGKKTLHGPRGGGRRRPRRPRARRGALPHALPARFRSSRRRGRRCC